MPLDWWPQVPGGSSFIVNQEISGPAIYMVASPIGNLNDLSPRALHILGRVTRIACEDTRHSLKLLRHFGIDKPLVSLHQHNEFQLATDLVESLLRTKETLAYLSDAGTPGVSDPGSQLAQAAHEYGVPVYTIPGPSAFAAAIAASGFHLGPVHFDGFFPRKATEQRTLIESWQSIAPCRIVFFESPNRFKKTLVLLAEVLPGDTEVCVCRELSKVHEQNQRFQLRNLPKYMEKIPERGEFTIVIQVAKCDTEGSNSGLEISIEKLGELARRAQLSGTNLKTACKELSLQHPSFSAKQIYHAAQQKIDNKNEPAEGSSQANLFESHFADLAAHSPFILGKSATPRALETVKSLLSHWFQMGLTRKEGPELLQQSPFFDLEVWCAQVYKRGFLKWTINGQPCVSIHSHTGQNAFIPKFSTSSPRALLEHLRHETSRGEALCLIDQGFASHWREWSSDPLIGCVHFYNPTEETKTLDTVRDLAQKLRPETKRIWTIGGGILSDIGGFLAGLFGLEHHSCPTTLLSASDASIGGKTGVNFPPFGKNQLGLFHGTKTWVVVPEFFETLNAEQILCGLAETLKHLHLAGGHARIRSLVLRNLLAQSKLSSPELEEIISLNFSIKSSIVEVDPNETGPRAALNLGHTVAHVLEGLGSEGLIQPLPHGIAVALGMTALIRSEMMSTHEEIEESLNLIVSGAYLSLPLRPHAVREELLERIRILALSDKKAEDKNQVVLSLPAYGCLDLQQSLEERRQALDTEMKKQITLQQFLSILGHVLHI